MSLIRGTARIRGLGSQICGVQIKSVREINICIVVLLLLVAFLLPKHQGILKRNEESSSDILKGCYF